ncbi:MAG: methionyl-tRNA formyltransferase [Pseudomonadota bacterium]
MTFFGNESDTSKGINIIAASKPWYKEIKNSGLENFVWVSNKDELNEVVTNTKDISYIFFLHWNWLVPKSIWQKFECVCFHMTDVPYGRGGSPLQNLIERGHTNTKLSALRMVEEMDAGPVYTKRHLSLDGTAHDIYLRVGELSFEVIQWMIENEPHASPQVGEPVYFKRRKPEQSRLPLDVDTVALYDHIRMLDAPTYPLAFLQHGDFTIEFSQAAIDGDELTATVRIRKTSHEDKT